MADAGRPPDFSDLNPEYAARLAKFRTALDQAGIGYSVVSGYRTPEYQNQMYQNHLAKQSGSALPYPDVEAPGVVAPAWRSFHNYGLAADFTANNPADYARIRAMAPQYGLSGIGASDPGHIQMAGTLDQNINQYKLAGWRPDSRPAPDQGAVAYGGPPANQPPANLLNRGTGSQAPIAAQPAPATGSHEAFIRDYAQKIGVNPDLAVGVANAEGLRAWSAANPNAGSYVDRTSGVPWSFGDFQLNTRNGMGADALKAGIDPRDPKQWQAADQFALDQMKSGGLAPWKGDPFAASWMKSGRPITGAGSAIASASTAAPTAATTAEPGIGSGIPTPAAPNPTTVAAAEPGIGSGYPTPAQPAAAPQNAGDFFKRLITRPPPTTDAKGNTVQPKSPLENLANSFKPAGGQQAPAAPQPAQFAPPQDPMAQLAGPSSQMFQAVSQAAARPLSWTSTPYGSMAGQQYPGRGTTLNSMGGYYGS